MRSRLLVILALFLAVDVIARADTISTFNLTGSSVFYGLAGDQNTVNGMVTINTTTGVVQNIFFTAGGVFQSGVDSQFGPIVYVGSSQAKISFDAGSLIGYTGSAFDLNGPNDLYVGHGALATAGAITPEPAGIVLLGTGLLGAAGLVRRRFGSAHA